MLLASAGLHRRASNASDLRCKPDIRRSSDPGAAARYAINDRCV